jgi:hypothetical protein
MNILHTWCYLIFNNVLSGPRKAELKSSEGEGDTSLTPW